jgi:undecaprenyl-diphosphatase
MRPLYWSLTLQQIRSTRPGIRWTDAVLFAAVVFLAAMSLAFYLGPDQWVLSTLLQSSIHWDASIWVRAFTRLGKGWLQIWLLFMWLLVSHRRRDVVAGLVALILVGIGVNALKLTIARPRPYETVKTQSAHHRTSDMSFPSGDTASAVAVTTAIWPGLSGPMPYLLPVACAAIGWLRIGGLAHYPSDVCAGAAVGLLAGWLAKRLVKRWAWLQRELPFERWLIWAGIVGIPLSVGLSKGLGEIGLLLQSYGVLIFALLLARRAGKAMRAA